MMVGLDYVIAPQVPRGLGPAVEGLAREILRERPRDIYAFATGHFERLVKLRDRGRIADRPLNGRDRVSTWAGLRDDDTDDYGSCSSNFGSGKSNVFVRDTTSMRELSVRTPIIRKVPKKKREATGRSGWSISQTVKVFDKYRYVNDVEDERLRDTAANERAIARGNTGDSERCSPRHLLEKIASGRLVRSSSAGNVFATDTEQFRSFVPYGERSLTNAEREYREHGEIVNILNRRRNADRVVSLPARFGETKGRSCVAFGRARSRSLANEVGTSGNEESTGIAVEECTGRPKGDRGSRDDYRYKAAPRGALVEGPRNEKKQLERTLHSPEEADTKSNIRSVRKGERELKTNEFIFDNVAENTPTSVRRVTSIVLPSVVVTRRKCTKENGCRFGDRGASSDDLTLPPIPTDTLTSIERNDRLELPPLLVAEDVRLNLRPSYCYGRAEPNLDRCSGEESVGLSETNGLESTNSDSEHSWRKCDENELSVFADPSVERHGTVTKEHLAIVGDSSPPQKDVGESFKDSLNVTPDLIDAPQRPDSLEYFEDRSTTPMTVDDERETGGQELRGEEACYGSNELKRKLIEIETVERNIENTLISSRSIAACENGFEGSLLNALPAVDDLNSVGSNSTSRNETALTSDTDTDTRPSNDTNEIDLSRCDLTADAPSRATKMLTTSIASNEHLRQFPDVSLERGFEETIDEGRRSDGSLSSRDRDTREEFREGCRDYVDPFGECVNSEIDGDSTAIVGVIFQRDTRSAVGRSTVCQDLENINEEEENENVKFSGNVSRCNDADSFRLDGAAESAEREKGIERETGLSKFGGNHEKADDSMERTSFRDPTNVTQTRSDERVEKNKEEPEYISAGMSTNSEANASTTYDDRSRNRSLSSDDIAPYIPELNLDSLQDLTISSLEENDSKYLKRNIEVENCDITSCDDENISPSFSNTLISEKNMTTYSSENESVREQFFGNRKFLATELDCASDVTKRCKRVCRECKSVDIPAVDENGETSLGIEENIADAPFRDFTEDAFRFRESTRRNNDQPRRLEKIGNDERTYRRKERGERGKQRGVRVEEEATDLGRLRSPSSSNEERNELSDHRRKCQEMIGRKADTISGLRHTGEFHDSLPLSLAELAPSVPTSDVYSLKAIRETANHRSPTVEPNCIKNLECTAVCGMSVSNWKLLQTTVSYAADISNSFRLFDDKPSWIESWLNDPSNVVYLGPIFNESFTDRPVASLADAILESHRDDCREPLALDNTPRPVVIEEISEVRDEREKWARVTSCETDTYFPATVGECSSKGNRNANSDKAGKKELFHGSLSTDEVESFIPRQNDNAVLKRGNAE